MEEKYNISPWLIVAQQPIICTLIYFHSPSTHPPPPPTHSLPHWHSIVLLAVEGRVSGWRLLNTYSGYTRAGSACPSPRPPLYMQRNEVQSRSIKGNRFRLPSMEKRLRLRLERRRKDGNNGRGIKRVCNNTISCR